MLSSQTACDQKAGKQWKDNLLYIFPLFFTFACLFILLNFLAFPQKLPQLILFLLRTVFFQKKFSGPAIFDSSLI